MKSVSIIYGSSTDNTKDVAKLIAQKLEDYSPTLKDVADVSAEDFQSPDFLFIGTSTWSLGELQDDWDSYCGKIKDLNLSGKTIAFFGTGDSSSYPDTFVDGIGILYEEFAKTGATVVGQVSTDDYSFDESRAVIDGQFVGLPLDADNESEKTADRIESWLESIKSNLD